ncbi:MAG: hypothetical protein ACYC7M_09235 [Bellilinea sp.]
MAKHRKSAQPPQKNSKKLTSIDLLGRHGTTALVREADAFDLYVPVMKYSDNTLVRLIERIKSL